MRDSYLAEEKKWLGVCAWIADQTGWSAKTIRLGLILATILPMGSDFLLLGGSLLFVYMITALVIRLVD